MKAFAPPAPTVAMETGPLQQRLVALATAISAKADYTTRPVYDSVLLLAPDGGAWAVTVSNTGTLSVAQVTR